MRFDWYQATVHAHPIEMAEQLLADLCPSGVIEPGRGRHNYYQSFTLRTVAGDRLACILAGGPNGDPNVTASGEITPDFVSWIRERFPQHKVTRFDAAEDFQGQGSWLSLESVCREVATEHQVKGRAIVPDDVSEGRTYYLGAPSSDVRFRLYEKTAELRRSLPPQRWSEVPDDWTRAEIQVRPKNQVVRMFAAEMTPEQVWGFSSWTKDLAMRAMALDVERITTRIARQTDDERAYRFMLKQYGKMLRRLRDDLGSWECVGATIGMNLNEM